MAKHLVKCKYCGKIFDTNTEEFIKPSSNRYAHKSCYDIAIASQSKEEQDKKELYEYINKIFGGSYNYGAVNKLIKTYTEEYKYSYSGIKKALVYWYEVKGNSIDKANGSIGIVSHIYRDAFNYYYAIWEANQKNDKKFIQEYIPEEEVVHILTPQRNIKKRKIFTFLDEEEK